MATINGKTNHIQHGVLQSVWVMGNADTGTPDQLSRYPYHSVQFGGTFGGATVVLQGSDDGTTYFTLTGTNAAGAQAIISATAAARFEFVNVPRHIRPSTSGGTGTAITVTLTSRSLGNG